MDDSVKAQSGGARENRFFNLSVFGDPVAKCAPPVSCRNTILSSPNSSIAWINDARL
jgi:hypothetical protein